MKKQSKILIIGSLLICMLFNDCKKDKDPDDCLKESGPLFSYNGTREGFFSKSPSNDTTHIALFMSKSMVGLNPPSLAINGRSYDIPQSQKGNCRFEFIKHSISSTQQPTYFQFGQNNTFTISGEICGTVTQQFLTPKELKVTVPPSYIIHRNAVFELTLTGVDDYPFPLTVGGNPQIENDFIGVDIIYDRKYSDTIAYPNLPTGSYGTGATYQKANNGKIIVTGANTGILPLNGGVSVVVRRNTTYKLPDKSKGVIEIQITQAQYDRFTIKD